jgi:hypothetical protein
MVKNVMWNYSFEAACAHPLSLCLLFLERANYIKLIEQFCTRGCNDLIVMKNYVGPGTYN